MRLPQLARTRIRAALRIHDRLTRADESALADVPTAEWDRFVEQARRLREVRDRGWDGAVRTLLPDVRHFLRRLRDRLDEWLDPLPVERTSPRFASVQDIHADLVALEEEFPNVEIDLRANALSAITEPIVLEGVDLGRFEIRLDWDDLGESSPYGVTALDADELGGPGSEFPHPHVRGETLCEGEGMRSIACALRTGRLLDFFEIVRQILQTYNSGSAYVQMARWHGRECKDCGDAATADESTACERCGRDLCLACSVTCGACRGDCCADCRGECAACDEPLCDRCAVWCDDCDGRFCPDCLTDGACASCRNLENPTDEAIPETAETDNEASAAAAVHADGVGQAPVPA